MSIITREQAKDLRNAFQCWQQDYDPVEDKEQYYMFGLGMVAMDALLASLEPVSVIKIDHESSLIKHVKRVVSETNAPPAPVSVPDEATPDNIQMLASTYAPRGVTYQWDSDECNAAADSWNACRAAMFQGAEQQQNLQQNTQEIIPGGLVEAVNNLLNNDGSRGRYSAMRCGEAREKIELWLAQRQKWESQRSQNLSAGNSPVIPDGYALVPVEPTEKMLNAWLSEVANWRGHVAGYKAMLAAAPQQEVKQCT
ncbi:hypothetical protein [Enterobacter cloacae]|uniref:hypothetical protein n=1 Tax=Enterobacter cloacae TaxID=550 RepID=UPI002FD856A2